MKMNPETLFVLWAMATAAIGGETPIKSLKLTGSMNAGGHAITNLAPGVALDSPATVGQVNDTNAFLRSVVEQHTDDAVAVEAAARSAADNVLGDMRVAGDTASTQYVGVVQVVLLASNAQAMAAAAAAGTNLQAAIDGEALARAAGDAVGLTNWQAVVYSLTNGAALGETALQPAATNGWVVGSHAGLLTPPATNTLAAAAAHAATAHSVTDEGGFQGGLGTSTLIGGAIGKNSTVGDGGGAIGESSGAINGGAVGKNAITGDGFAGGLDAHTTHDGTITGLALDAIQLGTGGNSNSLSLQIYTFPLMASDGNIPLDRFGYHNTNGAAHADIRALIPTLPDNSNIYTPIYAATTTIAVSDTQAVYKATFGTAGTVTQSIAGLTVSDTREARWELWLNATNPAALSPTWQGNLDWQGGTPELTVTGLYKFAMSTTGTRITGRQTYPTIHAVENIPGVVGLAAGNNALTYLYNTTLLGATATNNILLFSIPDPVKYYAAQIEYSISAAASYTNSITSYWGYWISGVAGDKTTLTAQKTFANVVDARPLSEWFIVPPTSIVAAAQPFYVTRPITRHAIYFFRMGATAGNVVIMSFKLRPANELEIKAYNAGWRP